METQNEITRDDDQVDKTTNDKHNNFFNCVFSLYEERESSPLFSHLLRIFFFNPPSTTPTITIRDNDDHWMNFAPLLG
jgi:hypothetical protein